VAIGQRSKGQRGQTTFLSRSSPPFETIELDREEDGRWIAEALELPGVMCYGQTSEEAISNAERLAIEVIADRIAHGELSSSALGVAFSIPDEHLARHTSQVSCVLASQTGH
jgi:predicted RNase H-like HicB family nuclease